MSSPPNISDTVDQINIEIQNSDEKEAAVGITPTNNALQPDASRGGEMTFQEKSRPVILLDSSAQSNKSKGGVTTSFQTADEKDFAFGGRNPLKPKIVHEEQETEVATCKSIQLIV